MLYRYIITQPDKEFDNTAATDAVAYRAGVRFTAEVLAEQSSPGQRPISFDLVVLNADGREIWRLDIRLQPARRRHMRRRRTGV